MWGRWRKPLLFCSPWEYIITYSCFPKYQHSRSTNALLSMMATTTMTVTLRPPLAMTKVRVVRPGKAMYLIWPLFISLHFNMVHIAWYCTLHEPTLVTCTLSSDARVRLIAKTDDDKKKKGGNGSGGGVKRHLLDQGCWASTKVSNNLVFWPNWWAMQF